MPFIEQIFQFDSEAALDLLQLTGEAKPYSPELLAIASIDRLLQDFGMTPRDIVQWTSELAPPSSTQRRSWSASFRSERQRIDSVLNASRYASADFQVPFATRSKRIDPAVQALRSLEAEGKLQAPVRDILRSVAHMIVNRLTRPQGWALERRIYDHLQRYHQSSLARLAFVRGSTHQ